MNKILVTGAGGFIGSHLCNYLSEKGYYVVGVDIKHPEYQKVHADEFYLRDLRDIENCRKLVYGMDQVYHLAANMGGIGYITSVFSEIMHDNTLMNINMLQASVDQLVQRFFFSSSACVYPEYLQNKPDVRGLKESDAIPADPDSYYGWDKLYTEQLVEAYNIDYPETDFRVARFHNIYGSHGTYKGGKEKAPAALCRKVAEAENPGEITVWGDGQQTRSFMYIDDCLDGFYALMNSGYEKPLNIGTDHMVTIDELAEAIIEISGKNLKLKHDLSKPQGVRGRNSDNTVMRRVLGWEPVMSLRDGLKVTYRWIDGVVNR